MVRNLDALVIFAALDSANQRLANDVMMQEDIVTSFQPLSSLDPYTCLCQMIKKRNHALDVSTPLPAC